ncbi:Sec-independent protein translocase protein TatB [Halioxenophilus sp. WMMB6]|uniref:Sec-independent protein translocase protein TatB n=1 Tax=Halioxenophilus sp. WMMB6 TaxID=3073815 RepID=UPI00295E7149|nr:Sec-independent protein translocase protein TatB [Halioxenophilus sp. WMMB6]
MFDIGFFELLLIAVVGLLVIGPERLPEALRSMALFVGRVKRGLRDTRLEFERQIGADDIRRQLQNEEIMSRLEQTRRDMNQAVNLPNQLSESLTEKVGGSEPAEATPPPADDKAQDKPATP